MWRRRDREKIDRMVAEMQELKSNSELLKTILMIREPETVTAANAYEGLRKQIVAAAGERRAHLTQLAQIDTMLHHTSDIDALRRVSTEWMEQAGVARLESVPDGIRVEDLFEILDQAGDVLRIVQPAYIDEQSGRVLRMGRAAYEPASTQPTQIEPIGDQPPSEPVHEEERL